VQRGKSGRVLGRQFAAFGDEIRNDAEPSR
jgi:hypothetical protein